MAIVYVSMWMPVEYLKIKTDLVEGKNQERQDKREGLLWLSRIPKF